MPIYAYLCDACGFQKDCLQKLSDAPLKICPECGQETFSKQLTAAGFQLKGSGWYATDFKGSGAAPAASSDTASDKNSAKTQSENKPATAPATSTVTKTDTSPA